MNIALNSRPFYRKFRSATLEMVGLDYDENFIIQEIFTCLTTVRLSEVPKAMKLYFDIYDTRSPDPHSDATILMAALTEFLKDIYQAIIDAQLCAMDDILNYYYVGTQNDVIILAPK